MTNYERLQMLEPEELAWVHMNNVTCGGEHGCQLCVYKEWSEDCSKPDRVCIDGHLAFLNREVTEEDEKMYAIAHNNVVIGKYNDMPDEERVKYHIVYRDVAGRKYANVIKPVEEIQSPFV